MGRDNARISEEGELLSTILRSAWDGVTPEPLTKREKIIASDPHV
jgi:hypothetical protein